MTPPVANHDSRLPHVLAVVLVCATFPLIWVGGMVTTYEAGMAVPDWPTTYGYNLFLYPWQTWLFGPWDLFVEHGHRLLGALIGMITIAVVVAVWLCDSRRWVKFYSVAVLAAVIGQGLLGGARVLQDRRVLAMIHGTTGPLFFAMTVALAVFTSRYWRANTPAKLDQAASKLRRLTTLTAVIAYLQIAIGAHLRHAGPMANPRTVQLYVISHLVVAFALVVHIALAANRVRRSFSSEALLRRPAWALVALIVVQLLLGTATWVTNFGWPAWFEGYGWAESHVIVQESLGQAVITTAHVATGSLIFVSAVLLALRSFRLVRWPAGSFVGATMMMGVAA